MNLGSRCTRKLAATVAIFTLACSAGINGAAATSGENQDGRGPRNRQAVRESSALKVGQFAPTFTLQSLGGEQAFGLKEFRGKRPVILFFGSYT